MPGPIVRQCLPLATLCEATVDISLRRNPLSGSFPGSSERLFAGLRDEGSTGRHLPANPSPYCNGEDAHCCAARRPGSSRSLPSRRCGPSPGVRHARAGSEPDASAVNPAVFAPPQARPKSRRPSGGQRRRRAQQNPHPGRAGPASTSIGAHQRAVYYCPDAARCKVL